MRLENSSVRLRPIRSLRDTKISYTEQNHAHFFAPTTVSTVTQAAVLLSLHFYGSEYSLGLKRLSCLADGKGNCILLVVGEYKSQ
ncbi:MAG: hypothetical protein ACI9D5_001684 [Candidatus Endobugula sp.]|jgi:hypothetical protein